MFKLPKVVEISLHDLIDNDLEGILDLLSDKVTGSPLLMDITYRVVGCVPPHTLYIEVDGDDSRIEKDAGEDWLCPSCRERGEPQETLGNGEDRYYSVACKNAKCDFEDYWHVPFTEADHNEEGLDAEGWPPCGMADCTNPARFADSAGVGYCRAHMGDGVGNPCLAVELTDFDPWWRRHEIDSRFAGLDYGVWPEGVDPGEEARPGWGLPAGPTSTNQTQEPQ